MAENSDSQLALDANGRAEIEGVRRRKRQTQIRLSRMWRRSWWRIAPPIVVSYIVVALFLWATGTPDAWLKAVAPVLAIMVFTFLTPLIKRIWFKQMQTRGSPDSI